MGEPNEKAVDLAVKIAGKARDTLEPLAREMLIAKWPAEFQAIVWGAVAQHAGILATEANEKHAATQRATNMEAGR